MHRHDARRIVCVNRYFHPDHSATSQMLSDLAFALADSGHAVTVVTSRLCYDDPAAALAPREHVRGVDVRRIWTSRFGRDRLALRFVDYLTFYVSAFFALLRLCSRDCIVVAKTDPPLIGVVAALAARLKGATLVNWLQDLFPEVAAELGVLRRRGFAYKALHGIRNWGLRLAEVNVAIGDRMAERLLLSGVARESIVVAENWADGESVRPLAADRNPLRADFGLSNKFVVGYSGNLGRSHDYETILGAAHRLRAEPDIVFLVMGGGARYAQLQRAAQAGGLENLLFRPYQPRERLPLSLTLPDVHLVSLLPELEGLIVPSKLYGVLAAGRPAIFIGACDGEVARTLYSTGAGVAIPLGDSAALASAIRAFASDSRRLNAMGVAGRGAYDSEFDFRYALAKWERLLAAMAADGTVAGRVFGRVPQPRASRAP